MRIVERRNTLEGIGSTWWDAMRENARYSELSKGAKSSKLGSGVKRVRE